MMATVLKQLPSQIDRILLPDVWELFEHWEQWPPEHVLLCGFTGYKPPERAPEVFDPEAAKGLTRYLGTGLTAIKPPVRIIEMVKWAEEMKNKLGVKVGES